MQYSASKVDLRKLLPFSLFRLNQQRIQSTSLVKVQRERTLQK